MNAADFLDTNILVYAHDDTDLRKQRIARDLVIRALQGEFIASTQVVAEFATTLLHKFSPPFMPDEAIAIIDALSPLKMITPDHGLIRRAVEANRAYGIHFYDGMIVAAAERGGCARILSEDLNPGQRYFGVLVANPF
jgi:predicted nucleic acid-binding protein